MTIQTQYTYKSQNPKVLSPTTQAFIDTDGLKNPNCVTYTQTCKVNRVDNLKTCSFSLQIKYKVQNVKLVSITTPFWFALVTRQL